MDYREMHSLAGDPFKVRMLATQISATLEGDLTPAAREFVTRLSSYDGAEPLSIREREWLFALRDRTSVTGKLGPYDLREMICRAYCARHDLNEDDAEAWIEELYTRGPDIRLSLSERRRLLFWLRRLGLVEAWVEID
jgi:hypothetical protein